MSVLVVNDSIDFITLKQQLNVTDGNIASHINALEKLNYVEIKKQFIGKKPNTSYAVTKLGRESSACYARSAQFVALTRPHLLGHTEHRRGRAPHF